MGCDSGYGSFGPFRAGEPGRARASWGTGMRTIRTRNKGTPGGGATRSFFAGQRPTLNPLTGQTPRAHDRATTQTSKRTRARARARQRRHVLTTWIGITCSRANARSTRSSNNPNTQPHSSSTTQAGPQNVARDHRVRKEQRRGHMIEQQPEQANAPELDNAGTSPQRGTGSPAPPLPEFGRLMP